MIARASALLALVLGLGAPALADYRELAAIETDPELERGLAAIAEDAFASFPRLEPGHLSITLVDLTDPGRLRRASFAGETAYHPASVVKIFYLAAVHREAAAGSLAIDPPLEAALPDMIVDSGNDATSYVVDVLTGTTSGPELSGRAWRRFVHRRNGPNRWFAGMGYDVNVNGKTWCEGVYGREKQLLGTNREYRNRVTSDAIAALALWIARRRAVSPAASAAMLALMERQAGAASDQQQVKSFGGEALPPGSHLWSKAGWTSEVRHEAMIVELPGGRKYVAAILTRGAGGDERLLPAISGGIVALFD
ncbi:MAG TPA: serine hydrolase [Thermoanaerobaculia bacterium]|nr:serine hydrolase [Thermoanaerobaculia bacterium]